MHTLNVIESAASIAFMRCESSYELARLCARTQELAAQVNCGLITLSEAKTTAKAL